MQVILRTAVFGLLASTVLAGPVAAGGDWRPSADPFDPPRIYITLTQGTYLHRCLRRDQTWQPYRWWITPKPKDQVNFGYYVGALSWWQPTFAPPNMGWTYNSNWVALTLTKTSWVTIEVGPTTPVPCAPPLQPAACDKGLCVSKTSSALMRRRNRLSWRNDRANPLCAGYPGVAVQVEEPA